MAKSKSRNIGDDQLVFGLPKHMSATATGDVDKYMTEQKAQGNVKEEHYWTAHPKPGACEKCRAMPGRSTWRNRKGRTPTASACISNTTSKTRRQRGRLMVHTCA